VINSPGFLPYLTGYGVPTEKIHVIPNGVDVTQFDPLARGEELRRAWQADGRFVVVYAGALGPANGLEVILDAADRLRETPALFVLVGDGKARSDLVAAAERRRLENVRFLPAQPKSLMPAVIAAADACVATLRDIPLFRTTYPNKVFDYMAAGRPVVLGIDGVIREVVEGSGAGVFVEPGNAVALAATVRRLMEAPDEARAMGARGRRAACATFDRRLQAAQLESVLAGLDRALRLDLRRILDLLLAVGLLPIALPVMLLVAVLVRVAMGSSVLFRHPRTGLRGRGFTLYKFRTMRVGDPELPDDARLTPFGRWLRSLSLDELPQLWNVLRGDMAIVGPRPLLPQYLQRYTPEQGRRHNVRPGITGLAQVSGRNALTWPEKFALDVWYVDHRSLRLDLWILWRTVVTVVHGRGIGAPGRATMPEFMGEAS
jgi:lipopolysaccharide/colanic/teichoic acid biosynthesis glycosyltransferase